MDMHAEVRGHVVNWFFPVVRPVSRCLYSLSHLHRPDRVFSFVFNIFLAFDLDLEELEEIRSQLTSSDNTIPSPNSDQRTTELRKRQTMGFLSQTF